ncbi:MAG TPA: hypothetical protein VF656_20805 [Pyrinomonadaceae bacterium]|jgi:hypothetical protein
MTNDEDSARRTVLALKIAEALRRHASDALRGGARADDAARAWLEADFADAEDVEDWLGARCFEPACAQALEAAGITPEQAALRTREGRTDEEDTVAYKFARGHLTLEEARRIITSDFWNS